MRTFIFLVIALASVSIAEDVHGQANGETPATLFGWGERPQPKTELGTIATDRPDFTEASSTVGKGVYQIEAGYTFEYDSDGATISRTHSWGEPLLRVGMLTNWLEFRTAWFPITVDGNTGSEDLYLGMKIGMTPQKGWLPESAILPQMTVPTGSNALTSDLVLPGVNCLYSWDLTEKISLAGSTQFNRVVDDSSDQHSQWAQSIALGRSLGEKWGIYSEWYGLFPHNANTARTEHYYNGGFTWLLSDDVQWDIRAGLGLNDAAADFFTGTGISIRFH